MFVSPTFGKRAKCYAFFFSFLFLFFFLKQMSTVKHGNSFHGVFGSLFFGHLMANFSIFFLETKRKPKIGLCE